MQSSNSPGLTFMLTALACMPRTLGDRVRINALHQAMKLALECRMQFAKGDAEALNRISQRTCVGVFRPFDEHYYTLACTSGGTFASLWEKTHGIKPWIAPQVVTSDGSVLADNRVAVGLAILLPGADDGLAMFERKTVWWCTSLDADQVVLCRYPKGQNGSGLRRPPGKPANIKKVSRDQWADLFNRALAA